MHKKPEIPFRIILIGMIILTTLACSSFFGVSKDVEQGLGTARAVVTQARGLATQAGPFLQTAQAFATQNPGILETVQAFATQNAPLVSTLQSVATANPGLVQTVQAVISQNLPSGPAPEDIPVIDQSQTENFYGSEQLLTYYTPLTFQEVLTFYKVEMSAFGWEADASASREFSSAVSLVYHRLDRTATVNMTVNPANQYTFVIITIQNDGGD